MSPAVWPSDLARKNQRLLAQRLRWPEGALQACADLEEKHPGWAVSWLSENTTPGFERPAGFWATGESADGIHSGEAFAATAEELEPLLSIPDHPFYPDLCAYCERQISRRLRRAGL